MQSDKDNLTGQATELCLSCGICCRGLLHSRVKLRPEEVAAARHNGLDIVEREELGFRLPCARFRECCTIYDERPRACQRFRCSLLRRMEDGEISIDEGLGVVREAKNLIREAETVTGPNELITRFRQNLQPAENAGSAAERLRLTALAIYLDKHFVLSRDGYFFSARAIHSEDDK